MLPCCAILILVDEDPIEAGSQDAGDIGGGEQPCRRRLNVVPLPPGWLVLRTPGRFGVRSGVPQRESREGFDAVLLRRHPLGPQPGPQSAYTSVCVCENKI